jgi:hypothetical protein
LSARSAQEVFQFREDRILVLFSAKRALSKCIECTEEFYFEFREKITEDSVEALPGGH